MFKILKKTSLNDQVKRIEIDAPLIAKKALAGQFVIVRPTDKAERIPLTVHKAENNVLTLIYQIVGATTLLLDSLNEGDYILDVVGPLGEASHLDGYNKALVVGGGLGVAISYPIALSLSQKGTSVSCINGFRNKDYVILEDDFKEISNLTICTDDGSYGKAGMVTNYVKEACEKENFDLVFIVGPLIMMKFVFEAIKDIDAKIVVSMNPIMIDGTGMCGGCRLTVAGKTKFACVDGPDFDARDIDFDEAIARSRAFKDIERQKYEDTCNLLNKEVK